MRSRSAEEVERTVEGLSKSFPKGIVQSVVYDTTRFVKVSIEEVVITLAEAMILVVLVVYLFLQNWRATFIPVVAVPVSLIGTLAGLLLMGYSINTLTLFGMVLAIGIVVDDAIVVLENVERIMHEEKLSAREAALKAMREVSGPVIAIVLVLCAVFVPIAFLGGLSGELYRQFAVTISMAVVISGIVALSLTPSLCVLMLKHEHQQPGALLPGVQPLLRARHPPLRRRRRLHGAARRHRAGAVRRHGGAGRLACGASRRGRWCPTRTRAGSSRP